MNPIRLPDLLLMLVSSTPAGTTYYPDPAAGRISNNGTVRPQGAGVDIGAYEFVTK